MDWTVPLRSQQQEFVRRLKLGPAALSCCQAEGCYSELTLLADEQLSHLRDSCWQIAKQKRQHSTADIRKGFIQDLPTQLGRAVVANWFDRSAISEVDPENRLDGNSEVDFTLTADPTVGIRVKTYQGPIEQAQWIVDAREIEVNALLICILVQEPIKESQEKYTLIAAGFLPTNLIQRNGKQATLKIDDLLYSGGVQSYLDFLQTDRVTDTKEAQTHYMEGKRYYEQKEFQQALSTYSQSIQLNPHRAETYYERGRAYYEIGNNPEALKDFDRALRINPDYGKAYLSRGLVRRRLKKYRGAIKDFNQALHFRPNHAKAYMNRGLVRCDLGDYEGAIEDCDQALHIAPDFAEAYSIRGMMRSKLGDKKGAIEDWNHALQADPNHPRTYFYRGFARYGLGDCQGAIDDYSQAVQVDPTFAEAFHYRGMTYNKLGQHPEAVEDFQKAAKLFFTQGRTNKYQEVMNKINELKGNHSQPAVTG